MRSLPATWTDNQRETTRMMHVNCLSMFWSDDRGPLGQVIDVCWVDFPKDGHVVGSQEDGQLRRFGLIASVKIAWNRWQDNVEVSSMRHVSD